MTQQEEENARLIDHLISQNRRFAFWRIPGDIARFCMQVSEKPHLLYDINELDEQEGFVIAPFHPSATQPIVIIREEENEIPSVTDFPLSDTYFPENRNNAASPTDSGKKRYLQTFNRFIRALEEKEYGKLVLSRSVNINRKSFFSPAETFYKALRLYPFSYVYLCHTHETGTWLGCTPEIILSGENGQWQTTALAGTQSLQNGTLPSSWDRKNREEQAFVADYIRAQLQSLGIPITETAPYSVRAGALAHLKNDFSFSLPDNRKVGDLLKKLHPTPAVCGFPKEESYRFILENEGHDRHYYSGFLGLLNPNGKSDLYVNLRCMQITPDTFTLYAGGGLLTLSDPESEWLETEAKMQTMKKLLE